MDLDTIHFQLMSIFLQVPIWNWVAGDLENVASTVPQGKSSGTVLPYVGVACLGAILFGYHLGYGLVYIAYCMPY